MDGPIAAIFYLIAIINYYFFVRTLIRRLFYLGYKITMDRLCFI